MARRRQEPPRFIGLIADWPIRVSVASGLTGDPESTIVERLEKGEIEGKKKGKIWYTTVEALRDWYKELPEKKDAPKPEKAKAKSEPRGDAGDPAEQEDPVSGAGERIAGLRLG
jgi:hypothetical protein